MAHASHRKSFPWELAMVCTTEPALVTNSLSPE
jgi:hypothetical protein